MKFNFSIILIYISLIFIKYYDITNRNIDNNCKKLFKTFMSLKIFQ